MNTISDSQHINIQGAVDLVYTEYTQVIASLIRTCNGDFELAEDVFQDAILLALEQWENSIPSNPVGWVYTIAKRRAIDRLRRNKVYNEKIEIIKHSHIENEEVNKNIKLDIDDKLRLIFTCCHPALNKEARVALTLQVVAGLNAKEVARSFLVPETTMAQRLVRAKRKIKSAKIPYHIPKDSDLELRLNEVLGVIYLIFNEGYTSTEGNSLYKTDLCKEAIRLGEMLSNLIPTNTEVISLYALMLLHDARRNARVSSENILLTLEEQNRSLWDKSQIEKGLKILHSILLKAKPNIYVIQASIAAIHSEAKTSKDTDWKQIVLLYKSLFTFVPTPIVQLNYAVAVGMLEGAEKGIELLNILDEKNELKLYHLFYSAKADFYRRLGRWEESLIEYNNALNLCKNNIECRYLSRRIEQIRKSIK